MTGYIKDHNGQRYKLPLFLSWEIRHTDGTGGVDSFEIVCPYENTMREPLEQAVYFQLTYGGYTVFYGVVDEYETVISQNGMTVTLTGRGMGAVLLDNRCASSEYISCGISDILRNYVMPYGITVSMCDTMPSVSGYSVSLNESALSAVTGYTQIAAGITPRFSKEGKLLLTREKGSLFKLDTGKAAECILRSRRCGVLSKVTVVTADGVKTVTENKRFKGTGGSAYVKVPRDTSWDMIRYTGAYQMEKSMEDRYTLEITVSRLFPAFPADICVIDSPFCQKGRYKVTETCCFGDGNAMGTTLFLTKEDG